MTCRILLHLFAVVAFSASSVVADEKILERQTLRELHGARYVTADFDHPLVGGEPERLAADGYHVLRPVGPGRYIVRVDAGAGRSAMLDGVELRPFTPEGKIYPTAWRAIRENSPIVPLEIIFQPDVTFVQARQLLASIGVFPRDPFTTGFSVVDSIRADVELGLIDRLARREEVMQIHGFNRQITSHNAQAARMSGVDQLHQAPYGLSGRGVVVSVYDIGSVQAGHPEFDSRVTAQTAGAAVSVHPTHVVGTIAARGIQAPARGMAPEVTVRQYSVGQNVFESKQSNFPAHGIRADNNSWGYIIGWNHDSSRTYPWVWHGGIEDFGSYAVESAVLDRITDRTGTLMIFSAGNDNNDTGPTVAPFAHHHRTDDTGVYCYSLDGSGNDCPATPCGTRCETVRHPPDGPFRTVSLLASAKNTMGVGAVTPTQSIAGFSSRGPTFDGRIKPEVVAKGTSQFSTTINSSYTNLQGTSMAAPVVTGIAALLIEQWQLLTATMPSPTLLRGLLVHSVDQIGAAGPDYTFGYGLVNGRQAADVMRADGGQGRRIRAGTVQQGATTEFAMSVPDGASVRATLVWNDPENTPYPAAALINDLDLQMIRPDGSVVLPWVLDPADPEGTATRGVNTRDNIEQIDLASAPGGIYRLRVTGTRVSTPQQGYVLLTTAELGEPRALCFDPFIGNDTPETAFGRVPRNVPLRAAICDPADVDYFRFTADRSGTVSVTVTATDTPLTVTLSSPVTAPVTVSVPVNGSATAQVNIGAGAGQPITPVAFLVRIAAAGATGIDGSYTLLANYPTSLPNRTRPARR
jgi:hypothetical protein